MAARGGGEYRHAGGWRSRASLHRAVAAQGGAVPGRLKAGSGPRRPERTGSTPAGRTCSGLPSGRAINLFFYDGPVSQAVSRDWWPPPGAHQP